MLKTFTFITLAVISLDVNAQFTITQQKVYGGNNQDNFISLFKTTDGKYMAAGYSQSPRSGDKSQKSRGSFDFWGLKINASGAIIKDKTAGGNAGDYLSYAEATTDGGYILGGWSISDSSGEKTQNDKGGEDYWIVKVDNTGNIEWDKTIGGDNNDQLKVIRQTPDGGYIAGGWSYSSVSGDKTDTLRGFDDYWIVKLDANGNIVWDKTIGGNSRDDLYDIELTSDGGYIVSGMSFSDPSGEKTAVNKGSYDAWIVKLDNNGSVQWDKCYGGLSAEYEPKIKRTSDNGYIICTYTLSNTTGGDKTEPGRGGYDYWVIKTDAFGNVLWDKTAGSAGDDYLKNVELTKDSGFVLCGNVSGGSLSGDKTEENRGRYDAWIVKLNKKGKIVWDKTLGGIDQETNPSILEVSPNYFLVGMGSSSQVSGDKTEPSKGLADYWLLALKYNPNNAVISAVDEDNSKNTLPGNFTIYPNPVSNTIHIQSKNAATYSVINVSGKTVISKKITGAGIIDVSGLQAGIYYVTDNSGTQKIVISK